MNGLLAGVAAGCAISAVRRWDDRDFVLSQRRTDRDALSAQFR